MRKPELAPRILKMIKQKTGNRVSEQGIRNALSRIRNEYSFLTLNAAAQIYAKKHGFSISKYLKEKDRECLRNVEIVPIKLPIRKRAASKKVVIVANYHSNSNILKAHLSEINKSYTYGCYTATFVLCRKVIENLLIHHIVKKKYPGKSKQERELYYDVGRGRYKDFEVILKNLRGKASDFGENRRLVLRICQLAGEFKDAANDMTHSLYHIAGKSEIDDKKFQHILDLIQELENKI